MSAQEDLNNFHFRSFNSNAPQRFFPASADRHDITTLHSAPSWPTNVPDDPDDSHLPQDDEAWEHGGGHDDGLGYYADGAKRHLTDEQVAMFRHSEVYAIVRAREVEQERIALELGSSDQEESTAELLKSAPFVTAAQELPDSDTAKAMASETPTSCPPPNPPVVHTLVPPQIRHRGNKRKRRQESTIMEDDIKEGRANRARVRELDAMAGEDHALDYGDEGTLKQPPTACSQAVKSFRSSETALHSDGEVGAGQIGRAHV